MDRNFISVVTEKNCLYWITERQGIGMCYDIERKELSYLNIPWKDVGIVPYGNAVVAIEKGIVYGVCCNGKYLFKYIIQCEELRVFEIGLGELLAHDYTFAELINDEIVIQPSTSNRVFFINVNYGEIRECVVIPSHIDSEKLLNFAVISEITKKERIPLFSYSSNIVVLLNLLTGEKEQKTYPDEIKNPVYIQEADDNFYILTICGDVYCLEKNTFISRKIYKHETSEEMGDMPFCTMTVKNNILWLLPFMGDRIICFDINQCKKSEYTNKPRDLYYFDNDKMSNYTQGISVNGTTYFAMHKGNYMFTVDGKGIGSFIDLSIMAGREYTKQLLNITGIVNEGEIGLASYISAL